MATTVTPRSTGSRVGRGISGAIFGFLFGIGLTIFLSQTAFFVEHLRFLVDMHSRWSLLLLPGLCALLGLLLGAFGSRKPRPKAG
jgi:ABC-type antimicrobial peptide transport system permease subunit